MENKMIFRTILLVVSILSLAAEAAKAQEKWSGTWAQRGESQSGQLQFILTSDGRIEGNITNGGTLIGLWSGIIRNDGVIFANYQYPTAGFAAQAVGRITQSQGNLVGGQMVFLQNNRVFADGSFNLARSSLSQQPVSSQYPFNGNGMYIYCAAPSICGQRGGNALPGNWRWTHGLFSDLKKSMPHVWCNLYPGSCGTR
jgi:hypothetical protein